MKNSGEIVTAVREMFKLDDGVKFNLINRHKHVSSYSPYQFKDGVLYSKDNQAFRSALHHMIDWEVIEIVNETLLKEEREFLTILDKSSYWGIKQITKVSTSTETVLVFNTADGNNIVTTQLEFKGLNDGEKYDMKELLKEEE